MGEMNSGAKGENASRWRVVKGQGIGCWSWSPTPRTCFGDCPQRGPTAASTFSTSIFLLPSSVPPPAPPRPGALHSPSLPGILLCPTLEGSLAASLPGLHLWAMGRLSKSWGSYHKTLGTWLLYLPPPAPPPQACSHPFPLLSSILSGFIEMKAGTGQRAKHLEMEVPCVGTLWLFLSPGRPCRVTKPE